MKDINPMNQKWKETLEEWTPDVEIEGWDDVSAQIPRGRMVTLKGVAQRAAVRVCQSLQRFWLLGLGGLVAVGVLVYVGHNDSPASISKSGISGSHNAAALPADSALAQSTLEDGAAAKAALATGNSAATKVEDSEHHIAVNTAPHHKAQGMADTSTNRAVAVVEAGRPAVASRYVAPRGAKARVAGKRSALADGSASQKQEQGIGRSAAGTPVGVTQTASTLTSDTKDSVALFPIAYPSPVRLYVANPFTTNTPLPAYAKGFLFWWKVSRMWGANLSLQRSVAGSGGFTILSADVFKEYRYMNRIGLRFDAGLSLAHKSEQFLDTVGRPDTLVYNRTVDIGYIFAGFDATTRLFESYKGRLDASLGARMLFFGIGSGRSPLSRFGVNPVGAICVGSRYKFKRLRYSPTVGVKAEYLLRDVSEIRGGSLLFGASIGIEL